MRLVCLTLVLVLGLSASAGAARPADETSGGFFYDVAEEPPLCAARACVHWTASGAHAARDLSDADGDGRPDAMERVLAAAERALTRETAPAPTGLGWRAPVPDGTLGGGQNRVDLYVKDLAGQASGTANRDPGFQGRATAAGFIQLERNSVRPGSGGYLDEDLIPHEIAHLVSYAYDGYFESWHGESTAEWLGAASSQTLAHVLGWLPTWAQITEQPLAVRRPSGQSPPSKAYAGWVWQFWLAERYGFDKVREVWEQVADQAPAGFSLAAVDRALAAENSSFFDEFVRFAAAHAEWRTAGAGFGARAANWPEVRRAATLERGVPVTRDLDHSAFVLYDVPVRAEGAVELRVRAPQGTASAVALVGRVGAADRGTAEVALRPLPSGGEGRVSLAEPGRFERLTAVVINGDNTLASPRRNDNGEWTYAKDAQRFELQIGQAAASTAPASPDPAPAGVEQATPSSQGPLRPPPVGDDLLAPALRSLRLAVPPLRVLRAGRAVRATAVFDEPARIRATLSAGGRVLARAERRRVTRRATLTLRPDARALRRLAAGRRRPTTLTLRLVLTDARGNTRTVTRRVVLRRG